MYQTSHSYYTEQVLSLYLHQPLCICALVTKCVCRRCTGTGIGYQRGFPEPIVTSVDVILEMFNQETVRKNNSFAVLYMNIQNM